MRYLTLLVAAACAHSQHPRTPFEKHVHDELDGPAKVRRDPNRSDVVYEAERTETIEFELDANGDLTRTSIDVPAAALPAIVRATAGEREKHIAEARVVLAKGTVVFWFSINGDEHFVVDASGTVVSHWVEEADSE